MEKNARLIQSCVNNIVKCLFFMPMHFKIHLFNKKDARGLETKRFSWNWIKKDFLRWLLPLGVYSFIHFFVLVVGLLSISCAQGRKMRNVSCNARRQSKDESNKKAIDNGCNVFNKKKTLPWQGAA